MPIGELYKNMNRGISTKLALIGLFCLLALGGLALYGEKTPKQQAPEQQLSKKFLFAPPQFTPTSSTDSSAVKTYSYGQGDNAVDFTFTYPARYLIVSNELSKYSDGYWQVRLARQSNDNLIFDTNFPVDFPPQIALRFFNTNGNNATDLSAWLAQHMLWGTSTRAEILEKTTDSIKLQVSGLYETDAYVSHFNNHIVVAEAEWQNANDPERKDVMTILNTLMPRVVDHSVTMYTNNQYRFSLSYPAFYAYKTNMPLLEAGSEQDVAHAEDYLSVTAFVGNLNGKTFSANDGEVSGVFAYDAQAQSWVYKGFTGYDSGDHPVVDVRQLDASELVSGGWTPQKYTTPSGLIGWIVKATDAHSTQGGCIWQTAFVESPDKSFTLVIKTQQAYGYSCVGDKSFTPTYNANAKTIYKILDSLQFTK